MTEKLLKFLIYEKEVLAELIRLAEEQQKALVKFDMNRLEKITELQERAAITLKDAEDGRIRFLIAWLGINRKDAHSLRLSSLEHHFKGEDVLKIRFLRKELSKMFAQIREINSTNRVLVYRASRTVTQIITAFSNGRNVVCNVTI
ncbi:MAG: hypothetical protein HW421_465 [Ignavibacteria bacterium]|nr:hypothetical protein [Ignavibacteria bacterium]